MSSEAWAKYVDEQQQAFVERLAEAVGIPSVSGDPAYRKDVHRMADWLEAELKKLGATVKQVPLGKQTLDGVELELPNAIVGHLGEDKSKKTVLVYGHFDVQPARKDDGWNTEPFVLSHDKASGRLYGRGSTDDKGPILGWLNAIEAHQKTDTPLPVNLKFCFEGMEESGSVGLEELVKKEAKGLYSDVDVVCISDNYWLNTSTPVLTYGLRGLAYYQVEITGPGADLHSGVFGGMVHEPMTDLFAIMSSLVSPQGEILIPGINELIAPVTDEERKRYEVMDYSISDVESSAGGKVALSDDKVKILMGRMRNPSLSLHGIEGAFSGAGSKTVIPAKIRGKFSLRLVPDLTPDNVDKLVMKHIESEFAKLKSKNTIKVEQIGAGPPWLADPNHYNYVAGRKATLKVYGKEPDFTREGGSIPITLTFADSLNKSVLLLPMGRGDDGAHSTNEKLDLSNYLQGTKLLGTYLHEIAANSS